jgi:hypothetical protein
MDKILNFVAYCVIIIIAFPITVIEAIFKIAAFVTVCTILIAMMFFAPFFKNFSWPKPIDKFIDYVFSMNFSITCKVIDTYKDSLNLN